MHSPSDVLTCRPVAVGLLVTLACLTVASVAAASQPVPSRHVLHRTAIDGWTLVVTAPTAAPGLEGAVLEASTAGHRVLVPLDTTSTGRRARAIDAIRMHVASTRLLLLTDQAYDRPGMIVVDPVAGNVVDTVTGRHMTLSPDSRFVAFEEFHHRLDTPWPWNETVYAVFDVTQSGGATRRGCPSDDDSCRGMTVHLPARADVCVAYREQSGQTSCLQPGRDPQHERRSPFVWLDAHTLAFVSVDLVRETAVLVAATFDAAGVMTLERYACAPHVTASGAHCPPISVPWMVDGIRRDDDDGQLWIHFRDRMPEVPGGWLGFGRPGA